MGLLNAPLDLKSADFLVHFGNPFALQSVGVGTGRPVSRKDFTPQSLVAISSIFMCVCDLKISSMIEFRQFRIYRTRDKKDQVWFKEISIIAGSTAGSVRECKGEPIKISKVNRLRYVQP